MRPSIVTELPHHILQQIERVNRRQFLGSLSMGVGAAALSQWMPGFGTPAAGAQGLLVPPRAPRAKRVIFLCMAGGPSHLETFDPKPRLTELDGEPMPASFTEGMPIAQLQGADLRCLGSRATFSRHGESGQTISNYLPHIATCADDIAIVNAAMRVRLEKSDVTKWVVRECSLCYGGMAPTTVMALKTSKALLER